MNCQKDQYWIIKSEYCISEVNGEYFGTFTPLKVLKSQGFSPVKVNVILIGYA